MFSVTATSLGVLVASNAALADEQTGSYHMMWGGGWIMGPVMMLIFLAIVVFLVVLLAKWLWPAGPAAGSGTNPKTAIAILEERFARGEIDRNEFEDRRQVLGG